MRLFRFTRLAATVAMLGLALFALSATAIAAPAAQSAPGESNLGYLLAGLIVIWVGFFAYVFYMSRKTREMRREIDELREQLARKERGG